ncbi:VanW family protein [Actinoplanes sp. NPDC051494]|uniref:VanW family protein n=1 Tax=Actinoplanes sp. NPDC051494 TaxID=3363907 RepID=UPI00378E03B8
MTSVSAETQALPAAPPDGPGPLNRKRVVVVGTVAAVLIAAAGVTAYYYGGDVPRGTHVLGVDLGGKSRSDAERALSEGFATRIADVVKVDLDGEPVELQAADIDVLLNVERTVGAAMKGSPTLFGERTVTPVVDLDEKLLESSLREKLDPRKVTLKKPAITWSGTTPKATYPQDGLGLDVAQAAAAVRLAWPVGETAKVPLVSQPAVTSKAEVDALIADVAKPAVSGPVTVTVAGKSFTLKPAAIAKGLVFRSDDAGELTPAVDGKKLRAAAAKEFATVEKKPVDARIKLTDGKPKVVADKPGDVVDTDKLATALLPVLSGTGSRTVEASHTEQEAKVTEATIAKLGVKEKVSTFTTDFTGGASSPRSQNIMTIARAVDGALVQPGETFSLNGHTGERDYAAGYKDAPVIVGGKLEPGVGGGASQFTTTLFNAAYYAGLEDVEHKPHSFYFSRYPSVIESTIFWPTLDLRFKNTTPHGIFIDTSYTNSSVTVTMWSTKVYDSVKTVYGPRRGITSPPTVHREAGPKCITSSGLPGFTQDAWRVIRKDGKEIEREKFSWHYDPEPRFVCGGEPESTP